MEVLALASHQIVVTGCGWVTPFCAGTIEQVLAASPTSKLKPDPADGFARIADPVLDQYANLPDGVAAERELRTAAVAIEIARSESGADFKTIAPDRVGIVLGCAFAGQAGMVAFAEEVRQQTPRFVSPIHFPQTVGNYPAGGLGRGYHVRGPNITLSGGAASGLDALITAAQLLSSGDADAVIAGGMEVLTPHLASCVDADVVPAEGACLFVLERAEAAARRGKAPLAHLRDFTQTSSQNWRTPDCALCSCAGCRLSGAVTIEHWIGGSLAAAGAAAVAAAIGAAWGLTVPYVDALDSNVVRAESKAALPGDSQACAIADSDGGGRTMIEFTVNPRP